jgi:hypothetical protein
MSLSTIQAEDAPPKHKALKQRPVSSLMTEDIEGAKPFLKGYQYLNKPEYSNSTTNIEKASSKALHSSLNKPEFNLKTSDIEKAQSSLGHFKSTRMTNPLNPIYKLPSFEVRPITPPKFVRDSIQVSDISGAKPEKYFKYASRDNINVRDIEGARPEPEKILVKPNLMDPKDINGETFKSKRNPDPLNPSYPHRDQDGNLGNIGEIPGARSKPIIDNSRNPHKRHLENHDIEGSRPGTVGMRVFATRERNYVKPLVENSDIEGSKPGTHKKGIVTKRITNPLNPQYSWVTEEAEEKEKNQEKTQGVDEKAKFSDFNNQAFWGTQVNQGVNHPRPATSKPFTIRSTNSAGFMRNVNKFFEVSTDSSQNKESFKVNCEKFYDNSNKRIEDKFLAAQNPNSIHRMKKKEIVVKPQEFFNDAKVFFGNSDGRPSRPSSCNSYQFKLTRKDIGLPVESL